ncbi:uncharacterized protein LOC119281140 [Triticum dicoccoides]|uniref:uncharacterized protein LOC119281140 n=1 Tax=Triticum dicoccoides TaxID=85692 RepID=UPI00188FF985|nr:uncharacterized protein LOC119281140 [Triticum dicoccoides]
MATHLLLPRLDGHHLLLCHVAPMEPPPRAIFAATSPSVAACSPGLATSTPNTNELEAMSYEPCHERGAATPTVAIARDGGHRSYNRQQTVLERAAARQFLLELAFFCCNGLLFCYYLDQQARRRERDATTVDVGAAPATWFCWNR